MNAEPQNPEKQPKVKASIPGLMNTADRTQDVLDRFEEEIFLNIANGGTHVLDETKLACLESLKRKGFILNVSSSQKDGEKTEYEEIQDTLKLICDTIDIIKDLKTFFAPRQILGFGFGGGNNPEARKTDFEKILECINTLKINGTFISLNLEITSWKDVHKHLGDVEKMLNANNEDCRRRLRGLEKNTESKDETPIITQLHPYGAFCLTKKGLQNLPEYGTLEKLKTSMNTLSGSHRTRIDDFKHLSDDPQDLIPFFFINHQPNADLATEVGRFEEISGEYEKDILRDISSFEVKNAFLIRLIRHYGSANKLVFSFLNKERAKKLLETTRKMIGRPIKSEWDIVYMLDIFLSGNIQDPDILFSDETITRKCNIFDTIMATLKEALSKGTIIHDDIRQDGQLIRLAIAIHQDMLKTSIPVNFSLAIARTNRVLQVSKSMQLAEMPNFPANGSPIIHGFHLAKLRSFRPDSATEITQKYTGFLNSPLSEKLSAQSELHIFTCLERLEEFGVHLDANEFRQMVLRIHRNLLNNPGISKITRSHEKLELLALNLATITAFGGGKQEKSLAEETIIGDIPLCGFAFKTLFIV